MNFHRLIAIPFALFQLRNEDDLWKDSHHREKPWAATQKRILEVIIRIAIIPILLTRKHCPFINIYIMIAEFPTRTKKLTVNVNVMGQPPVMAHFPWRARLASTFTFTGTDYGNGFYVVRELSW